MEKITNLKFQPSFKDRLNFTLGALSLLLNVTAAGAQNSQVLETQRYGSLELTNPITIVLDGSEKSLQDLNNATRVWHKDENGNSYCVAKDQDIIIEFAGDYTSPLGIFGGGDIVIKDGKIWLPENPESSETEGRALLIADCPGQPPRTALLQRMVIGGPGTIEGIQIASPEGTIIIEELWVEANAPEGSDYHTDLIQPWGGYKRLFVFRMTGRTNYQGVFLKANPEASLGETILEDVNIIGNPAATQLIWFQPPKKDDPVTFTGPVSLTNVWIQPAEGASFNSSAYPNKHNSESPFHSQIVEGLKPGEAIATWPTSTNPQIIGSVREGVPPTGDFVTIESN